MRSIVAAGVACILATASAWADCRPDALGTARTLVVDPSEHGRLGTMQYSETLPLADKEVVLTFDDGPLPPYSTRILDELAAECVKATFFVVGRMAQAHPELVRRAHQEGHTIATHSLSHPHRFEKLPRDRADQEIDGGVASAAAALGDASAVAPFFRVPGLRTSAEVESSVTSRGMMVWSADFPADDWLHISSKQVLQRALDRLERKGKGVILLHDIQPATALALPGLLKALKAGGYRIVHVVPTAADRPKTVTEPQQWVLGAVRRAWPRVVETKKVEARAELPVPSPESFGWPHIFQARSLVASRLVRFKLTRRAGYQTVSVIDTSWPEPAVTEVATASEALLPAPSPQSFGIPHPFGPNVALPLPFDWKLRPTAALQEDPAPSTVGLP